jgi:hypothetical protein
MTPLLTPSGAFDRAAIMRKAWRDYRRVRALGDVEMTLGDWLRNAWKVAKGQRGRNLLRDDPEALNLLDAAMQRRPGEDQPRDPDTGRMLPNVDNINTRADRPTGTSTDAGLRRLRKAAADVVDQSTGEVVKEGDDALAPGAPPAYLILKLMVLAPIAKEAPRPWR